ncbi:MAG: hypothetical protein Q7T63_05925 [Burkholderiaceae bacterium]|nr:hypothetical protein [Burkholderiaceae bacterium]
MKKLSPEGSDLRGNQQPLLQTLEIHEVITTQAVDVERAALKRKVRDVANGARNLATRLRREMNALEARRSVSSGENAPDGSPPPDGSQNHAEEDAVPDGPSSDGNDAEARGVDAATHSGVPPANTVAAGSV